MSYIGVKRRVSPLFQRGIKGDFINNNKKIPPDLPFTKGGTLLRSAVFDRYDVVALYQRQTKGFPL